jgi:methionine--tRNA ligase beta chain
MNITIDDFKKVELKVAKVLSAERVEGSDKLLKLRVDIGTEQRQIIAGIGTHYLPEAIVGSEIIIVANLEPRMLMGLESQGMLLAANGEGPVVLMPEKEVAPGTGIR